MDEIYVQDEAYTDAHGRQHGSFLSITPEEGQTTARVYMWSTAACLANYLSLDADELKALGNRCLEVAAALRPSDDHNQKYVGHSGVATAPLGWDLA